MVGQSVVALKTVMITHIILRKSLGIFQKSH
jgi:hypothetical protein